jgi:hypothetical protein
MVRIWVEKNRIEKEKGKESPIPNPSKNAAPGTYLGMSMPDLTSLESEKRTWGSPAPTLGLTGSGSRIRASQCDCTMTARSPSGSVARWRADAWRRLSSGRSPHRSPCSLARVETEAAEKTNELGFCGETTARWFCSHENSVWPSISDGRLTSFWALFSPGGRWLCRLRPSLL